MNTYNNLLLLILTMTLLFWMVVGILILVVIHKIRTFGKKALTAVFSVQLKRKKIK